MLRAAAQRLQYPVSWLGHGCGSFLWQQLSSGATFFTMTQRASMRLRYTCCCYGMAAALQMLACPRSGCGRLAGSDLKARSALQS